MKNLIILLFFILIFSFSSCNKKEEINYHDINNVTNIPTISLTVIPTNIPIPTNTPTPTPMDERMMNTLNSLKYIESNLRNININYLSCQNTSLLQLKHLDTFSFIPTKEFQLDEQKRILISNLEINLLLTDFFNTYFENFENYKYGWEGTITNIYIDNVKVSDISEILLSKNNDINVFSNLFFDNMIELILNIPLNTKNVVVEYNCNLYIYDKNLQQKVFENIIIKFNIYDSFKEFKVCNEDKSVLSNLLFNEYLDDQSEKFLHLLSTYQKGYYIDDIQPNIVKPIKKYLENDDLNNFTSHAFFNMKYFEITYPYYYNDSTNMTEMTCCDFNIYNYELFDFQQIFQTKKDDIIYTFDEYIKVNTVDRFGEYICFNDEYYFKLDNNGYYYQIRENGEKVLMFYKCQNFLISPNCIIEENDEIIFPGKILPEDFNINFDKYVSEIVVENGIVVKLIRNNLIPIEKEKTTLAN